MPRNIATLRLADATAMIRAAEIAATALGIPYCVAVVDAGGHLLAFSRQDDAMIGCIDLAVGKARTARLFDKPAAEIQNAAQPGAELYGIQLSNGGSILIGGGIPAIWDGTVIGAIGASAGTVAQDVAFAEAGMAAL